MDADAELLQALVRGFDRAMLVTRCEEGLRSRPSTVANTGDTERLWLLSGIVGDPLDELTLDPNVNVVMQDETRFCSVTGTARIARASGEESIWTDQQREWLARGAQRSSLLLIEVVPQYAEYWDRSGLRGLRFDTRAPMAENRAPDWMMPEPGRVESVPEPRGKVIFVEPERWKR